MSLTADVQRVYGKGQDENCLPVKQATVIYAGSAVGLASGYARPLVAGDAFQGFALKGVDNANGADGGADVTVRKFGTVTLNVTGVTGVADVGSRVYASDDGTFTKTEGTNTYIGTIIRWETGTQCVVKFDAPSSNVADAAAATAAALTDNTGQVADVTIANIAAAAAITDNSGGADPGDNTIAAITNAANAGSADVAPVQNAIAQLAAKLNTTSTALGVTEANISDLTAQVNALIADVAALRTVVNSLA